jgi:hypothetical protein
MAIPQVDNQYRGPSDNTFRWTPTAPQEVKVAVSGDVSDYTEITYIKEYEIGITPDLGWDNVYDMFTAYSPSNPDSSNTKLFTKNGLSVESETLEFDIKNNQLVLSLTADDMDQILSPGYKDYLWAVRGYSNRGVPSEWSEIRKFHGKYEESEDSITVTDLDRILNKSSIVVRGTKSESIRAVEINGQTGNTRYPNSFQWEAEFIPDVGTNTFNIRGLPYYGNPTQVKKIETTLHTGEIGIQITPNHFDEWGALYGVDRITSIQESNKDYANRIKDVFIHRGESNLRGLHHSICRDLALNYDDYALVLRPHLIQESVRSDDLFPNLRVFIDTNYLYIDSRDFWVNDEYHELDPQDDSFVLNYDLSLTSSIEDVEIKESAGKRIDRRNITYNEKTKKYHVHKNGIDRVWVNYPKMIKTVISKPTTLSELKNSLNSLSYNGTTLIDATLSSDLTGNESADGLVRGIYPIRTYSRYFIDNSKFYGVPLRWSNLSVFTLIDESFWDRYINENGHLLNTKIESYVDIFKNKFHLTWDQIVLDEDVWDPILESTEEAATLPFVLDAYFGYWTSSSTDRKYRYDTAQAFDRGFICQYDKSVLKYVGIAKEDIKSGIGRDQDLKVVIPEPRVKEVLTEPDVYKGKVSWTVTGQVDDSTYLPSTPYGSLLFEL